MYCENCGKKLIRGYQFCMECGTPVPPVNTDPLGGEFGGISDSDLARIDNFVNNSGLGGDISYDVSGGSDDMGGLGGGLGGIYRRFRRRRSQQ